MVIHYLTVLEICRVGSNTQHSCRLDIVKVGVGASLELDVGEMLMMLYNSSIKLLIFTWIYEVVVNGEMKGAVVSIIVYTNEQLRLIVI